MQLYLDDVVDLLLKSDLLIPIKRFHYLFEFLVVRELVYVGHLLQLLVLLVLLLRVFLLILLLPLLILLAQESIDRVVRIVVKQVVDGLVAAIFQLL